MRLALATLGTTGDVVPFALLARELAGRGHEMTAISWPVHRTALAQPGVRVEVAGPYSDPTRLATVAAEAASRGPMDQVAVLRDFHLADAALSAVADPALGHGAHELASAMAREDGLATAIIAIESLGA